MKPERRMQLKDFIKLNKSYGDMNGGKELREDFLVDVYKSIASEQIFTSSAVGVAACGDRQTNNDQLRSEQWVNVIRQTHIPQTQQFIAHSPAFFTNCTNCDVGMYDRDIFSIIWGPILAAAGAVGSNAGWMLTTRPAKASRKAELSRRMYPARTMSSAPLSRSTAMSFRS